MGDEIAVDTGLLLSRLTALYKHFTRDSNVYGNANALQFVHGKRIDTVGDGPFAVSLQLYLFGYEFPDTISVLAGDTLYVHASQKKLDYLKAAEASSASNGVKVRLLVRDKGDNSVPQNRACIDEMIGAIRSAGGVLATLPTDPMEGPIAQGWVEEVAKASFSTQDGTRGVESYFASKDDAAIGEIRKAGVLAARILKYVMVPTIEGVIDADKKKSHADLAAGITATVDDRAALEKAKVPIDTDSYELVLPPLIQSGGEYEPNLVRYGLTSSASTLAYDVIIVSLGVRYKGMRAAVARTLLIDPTPKMQKMYDIIETAQQALINRLKPGVVIKDAVVAVRDELLNTPGLPMSAKMVRNCGTSIGVRVQDKTNQLGLKNDTTVQPGMAYTVLMGLSDIPMEDAHPVASAAVNKLKSYTIVLADTVVVSAEGPVVVTDKATKDRKQVVYEMAGVESEEEEEDEDEDEEADGGKAAGRGDDDVRRKEKREKRLAALDVNAGRDATGRSARLREKAKEVDPDAARKREEHQSDLVRKKQEEIARGGRRGGGDGDDADDIENAPDIVGYRTSTDLPKGISPNQIFVDKSRECVLLPILGTLVPFHISTIKSVNKTEEGHKAFLRINFYSSGVALGKDAAPTMQAAVMRHPDAMYIRTLNFMSRDHKNFVDVDQKIKAMLKAQRTQRKEEKETAGLIEQARVLMRKDGVVPKMVDINMWPSISGRATQGTLSAHVNGLIFNSNKGERLEITYANIKTAVFQPCEGEHVVLLHFHLKHPILVGKKKHREIQFFTEVVERNVLLDGRGRSDYDPDELNEEERERQLRVKLNKAFKTFVSKVEDAAALDAPSTFRSFEIPPRDLAFTGAWAKEMTTVLLGSNAIVAVVEKPPLVVPVDDIELVHFERVAHGGKSFDMVIVFKAGTVDKGTDEYVRISSIEMKHLETIKTWLDEVAEVVYTESMEALVWKLIIAEQVRDPNFWLETDAEGNPKHVGMMEVLYPFADGAVGEGDEEEEEESEEYSEDEDDDDEDEEDDDEDFDDLVDEDEDDDDDSDAEESGSEAGEDWDELERKAEEDDRKRGRREEESDDDDKKRKDKKKRR